MANYLRFTWQACDPSAYANIKSTDADKADKLTVADAQRKTFSSVDNAKEIIAFFDDWNFSGSGASATEWSLEDSGKTLVLKMSWADGDTDKMATFNESAKGWQKSYGKFDASKWDVEVDSDPDWGYGQLFPGAGTTGNKVVIDDKEV